MVCTTLLPPGKFSTSYVLFFRSSTWNDHQHIYPSQGVSDTPAWLVTKANEYARSHGKTPFVVYQAAYSVLQRDIERDILPMCRHEGKYNLPSLIPSDMLTMQHSPGIALTLWNVLAGGHIRSDAEEEKRRQTGEGGRTVMGPWERTPSEKKVCDALEAIAKQVGAKHITAGMSNILLPDCISDIHAFIDSCYRVHHAQSSLRLPYDRRP